MEKDLGGSGHFSPMYSLPLPQPPPGWAGARLQLASVAGPSGPASLLQTRISVEHLKKKLLVSRPQPLRIWSNWSGVEPRHQHVSELSRWLKCALRLESRSPHLIWLYILGLPWNFFFFSHLLIILVRLFPDPIKTVRHVRQNTGWNVPFHETDP